MIPQAAKDGGRTGWHRAPALPAGVPRLPGLPGALQDGPVWVKEPPLPGTGGPLPSHYVVEEPTFGPVATLP